MGPMEKIQSQECHVNVNFVRSVEVAREDDCHTQQVERFWAIENFGVTPDSKPCMSVEDKKALTIMEKSVKPEGGRYQVALPWKQYPPFLPYNRPMAERRLQALKKRFIQDGELFGNYKATMNNTLTRIMQEEYHKTSFMQNISRYGICLITRCLTSLARLK